MLRNSTNRLKEIGILYKNAVSCMFSRLHYNVCMEALNPDVFPTLEKLSSLQSLVDQSDLSATFSFICYVTSILNRMDTDEATIIYFQHFTRLNSNWWKNKYKPSTFYRIYREAAENFLNIYEAKL